MFAGSTALTIVGVLILLAAIAFIALDYLGKGDTSGLDYKDVGILVLGLLLAGVGVGLGRRKKPAVAPAASA